MSLWSEYKDKYGDQLSPATLSDYSKQFKELIGKYKDTAETVFKDYLNDRDKYFSPETIESACRHELRRDEKADLRAQSRPDWSTQSPPERDEEKMARCMKCIKHLDHVTAQVKNGSMSGGEASESFWKTCRQENLEAYFRADSFKALVNGRIQMLYDLEKQRKETSGLATH